MTPHVINSEAGFVTSEREEIVVVERHIVPITLAELDYAQDVK